MAFPKRNKILLLLVSTENPLWKRVFQLESVTQEKINQLLAVAAGSVSNWRHARRIDPKTEKWIFHELPAFLSEKHRSATNPKEIKTHARLEYVGHTEALILANVLQQVGKSYYDGRSHIYRIGQLLGMSIELCQKIIDRAIYTRFPMLSNVYYDNDESGQSLSDQDYNLYRGVYFVSVRRYTGWLQAVLRVRYVVEIGDGLAIRCKLNFPIIDPEELSSELPYWEYDGFLSVRSRRLFWVFEKRQQERGDFFYMVTCLGRVVDGRRTIAGRYVTSGQDVEQSVVSDEVVMQRIETTDLDRMEGLMHSSAMTLRDPHKIAAVTQLCEQMRS